jgi:tetratricopeptide (TPR) repeat protein
MPRWLSEGISVYEERQANPAWGEHANPRYREMLLGKDFNPISKLSGAFLTPKSALHLQFAYYESSLVVQFLVEHFGREKLVAILRELAQGREVDEALAKHTFPMPKLEEQFASFARKHAEAIGPGVDWERPTPERLARSSSGRTRGNRGAAEEEVSEGAWKVWSELRPTNYWVMLRRAENLADEKNWSEALPILRRLVEMYPDSTGASSPYHTLAMAHRELGDTNSERQVLIRFTQQDDQAPDAYVRLMELGSQSADWGLVLTNAERYLAVNPLVPATYRFLAQAGEATGKAPRAIEAYNALLQLDPANPGEVHFHLARLLYQQGDPAARRHVLQALEEAPRYRDALKLLRIMRQGSSESPQTSSSVSSMSDPET